MKHDVEGVKNHFGCCSHPLCAHFLTGHVFSLALGTCFDCLPPLFGVVRCVRASFGAPPEVRSQQSSPSSTTSMGHRCFEDDSLDLVYIDADHKWWSVLQDSSALALQLARVQGTRDNSMRVFHCQRGPGEASPREGKWLLSSAIPSNCCVQNQQEQSDAAGQNPISEEGPASSALC